MDNETELPLDPPDSTNKNSPNMKLMEIGYEYMANGDYNNAVRYLQYAADSETAYNAENPAEGDMYRKLAECYWNLFCDTNNLCYLEKCRDTYGKALRYVENAGNPTVLHKFSQVYYEYGSYDVALEMLNTLITRYTSYRYLSSVIFLAAVILGHLKEYKKAVIYIKKILEEENTYPENLTARDIYLMYGYFLETDKNEEESKAIYQKAFEQLPSNEKETYSDDYNQWLNDKKMWSNEGDIFHNLRYYTISTICYRKTVAGLTDSGESTTPDYDNYCKLGIAAVKSYQPAIVQECLTQCIERDEKYEELQSLTDIYSNPPTVEVIRLNADELAVVDIYEDKTEATVKEEGNKDDDEEEERKKEEEEKAESNEETAVEATEEGDEEEKEEKAGEGENKEEGNKEQTNEQPSEEGERNEVGNEEESNQDEPPPVIEKSTTPVDPDYELTELLSFLGAESNYDLVLISCETLKNLLFDDDNALLFMRKCGFELLVTLLDIYIHKDVFVELAVRIVEQLCTNETDHSYFHTDTNIRLLLHLLTIQAFEPIYEYIYIILAAASSSDDEKFLFNESNCVKIIMNFMYNILKNHKIEDYRMLESCTRILHNLSKEESQRKCIFENKECLNILLTVLDTDNINIIRDGLGLLYNLTSDSKYVTDISRSNCIEIIIPIFKYNEEDILITLCQVCCNLTTRANSKMIFGDLGGIVYLEKCLKSDNIELQIKAAQLLSNVSVIVKNKNIIMSVPTLYSVILTDLHHENEELKMIMFKVICNLSSSQEQQSKIDQSTMIQTIFDTLSEENLKLDIYLFRILWNLTAYGNSKLNQEEIMKRDGITILLIYLEKDDIKLKTFILGVLYNLTNQKNFDDSYYTDGIIKEILSYLAIENVELNIYASALLKNFCRVKVLQSRIVKNEGIGLIITCLTRDDKSLKVQCASCLRSLACNDDYRKLIGDLDGVKILMKNLSVDDYKLQYQILGALKNLAVLGENRHLMGLQDGIEIIIEFIKSKDSNVVKNACDLLYNLAIRYRRRITEDLGNDQEGIDKSIKKVNSKAKQSYEDLVKRIQTDSVNDMIAFHESQINFQSSQLTTFSENFEDENDNNKDAFIYSATSEDSNKENNNAITNSETMRIETIHESPEDIENNNEVEEVEIKEKEEEEETNQPTQEEVETHLEPVQEELDDKLTAVTEEESADEKLKEVEQQQQQQQIEQPSVIEEEPEEEKTNEDEEEVNEVSEGVEEDKKKEESEQTLDEVEESQNENVTTTKEEVEREATPVEDVVEDFEE